MVKCEMRMTLRPIYLVVATMIFVVEAGIAAGLISGVFVRNSLGDALATALLYCVVRGLSRAPWWEALLISVGAGCITEFLQYLHLADGLGLKPVSIPSLLLGATFSRWDVVMYGVGSGVIAWLDVRCLPTRRPSHQIVDEPPHPDGG